MNKNFFILFVTALVFTACSGYEPSLKSEFNISNQTGKDLVLNIYYQNATQAEVVSIPNTGSYSLERYSYGNFPNPFLEYGVDSIVVKYADSKKMIYGTQTPQANENILYADAYNTNQISGDVCSFKYTFTLRDYMKAK